ncbi:Ig-like domain-containing protein [Luteimonas sp. TWI662]|uniref:Ig-like domain-containing protein n=1 Tax=Luteimonas sp. TWI662 TaxID=3136789 RepID=UPI0032083E45
MAELVANNDEASTPDGEAVTVDVLANDTLDGAPVQLRDLLGLPVIVSGPSSGSATVNSDGSITYVPERDFSGVVVIEYEIAASDPGSETVGSDTSEGQGLVFSVQPPWWSEVLAQEQQSPGSVGIVVANQYPFQEPGPDAWGVLYQFQPDGKLKWIDQSGEVPFSEEVEADIYAVWDSLGTQERSSPIRYFYARY